MEERNLAESPAGEGRVFKKQKLIADVFYELQVFQDPNSRSAGKSIVTGKIKRVDKANIFWGIEEYTLHLQDKRKLDFMFVNYDPDCEINSDKGFYF